MFSSRSTFYIAILKPQRPQKQQPKTKQNKVMGLSTFHLVEPAHSTSAFTSLVLYQPPPCVCVWFWHILLGEISTVSSFIHSQPHFLFFQRGYTSNKTQIHLKKVENNPKTHICCHQSATIRYFFATHAPYIFSFIFFSQTLSRRSSPASPTCGNIPFLQCHPGDATRPDNGCLSNYPSHMETTPCLYVDRRQST